MELFGLRHTITKQYMSWSLFFDGVDTVEFNIYPDGNGKIWLVTNREFAENTRNHLSRHNDEYTTPYHCYLPNELEVVSFTLTENGVSDAN